MIRIATAECFTHGKIGAEIHAFSRGYPHEYRIGLDPAEFRLSVVASTFIPTLSGIRYLLKFEPLKPDVVLDEIKVYDQDGDLKMALKMAEAIRDICRADIGIGTTAGIGEGAVAVAGRAEKAVSMSGVHANLQSSGPEEIMKRQDAGIKKALHLLEDVLKEERRLSNEKIRNCIN